MACRYFFYIYVVHQFEKLLIVYTISLVYRSMKKITRKLFYNIPSPLSTPQKRHLLAKKAPLLLTQKDMLLAALLTSETQSLLSRARIQIIDATSKGNKGDTYRMQKKATELQNFVNYNCLKPKADLNTYVQRFRTVIDA